MSRKSLVPTLNPANQKPHDITMEEEEGDEEQIYEDTPYKKKKRKRGCEPIKPGIECDQARARREHGIVVKAAEYSVFFQTHVSVQIENPLINRIITHDAYPSGEVFCSYSSMRGTSVVHDHRLKQAILVFDLEMKETIKILESHKVRMQQFYGEEIFVAERRSLRFEKETRGSQEQSQGQLQEQPQEESQEQLHEQQLQQQLNGTHPPRSSFKRIVLPEPAPLQHINGDIQSRNNGNNDDLLITNVLSVVDDSIEQAAAPATTYFEEEEEDGVAFVPVGSVNWEQTPQNFLFVVSCNAPVMSRVDLNLEELLSAEWWKGFD